jgi:hypothetical protein
MKKIILLISAFALINFAPAQQKQTVRGQILDKQAQFPLIGASVTLLNSDPLQGTTSDADGKYRLENVLVGRQSFKVSYVGYKDVYVSNIVVSSGKELVLNFELEEAIVEGEELVIKSKKNKGEANNELITVSGRSFSIDETQRFAGSLGDPSRMASNFAGVAGGGNDQRNDIIIRGNSPLGLLWRLEGADIPNPNHFGNQGANGGPVSILNNNTLANSDFITGAWPAEYGSASSGVFDLKMRNGNNEKNEYTAQIGFNGVELMAEGPIKKGGASYLISYRYSTLAAFDALGISFGESGIPFYQDLTFKFNFPETKLGSFSLFGIGGKSNTDIFDSKLDSTARSKRAFQQDIQFNSAMGVGGLTHTIRTSKNAYIKTVLSVSGESNRTIVDSLSDNYTKASGLFFSSNSKSARNAIHTFYNHKINARSTVKGGFIATRFFIDMVDSLRKQEGGYRRDFDLTESTFLTQAYINWQYKPSAKLVINSGLHFNHLFLNNSGSIEPRISTKYSLNSKSTLSLGYGLHGQGQPLPVYFQLTEGFDNSYLTNKNLSFTNSHHIVGGYELLLSSDLRLKTEAYFQQLNNVPVTQTPSFYSVINFGADFGGLPNVDSLVNEGSARNYGMELTLEKFFSRGYYYLVTASVFESKYKASDAVWRNTAFNSNFVINVLAGKEYTLRKNNILSFNIKVTYAGGRREVPINLEQSRLEGQAVLDYDRAYESRLPDFFRTDFRIGYTSNSKRFTQEWALDLRNVFNIQNIFLRQFNPSTGNIEDLYQIAFFPVPLYRLQF